MLKKTGSYVRRHHWGLIATFIALSGAAYATTIAPQDSVRSSSIKDRQVNTQDLHRGAVTPAKAGNVRRIEFFAQGCTGPADAPTADCSRDVLHLPGFVLHAECYAEGGAPFHQHLSLTVIGSSDSLNDAGWTSHYGPDDATALGPSGEVFDLDANAVQEEGVMTHQSPGHVVTVVFHGLQHDARVCHFFGTATRT